MRVDLLLCNLFHPYILVTRDSKVKQTCSRVNLSKVINLLVSNVDNRVLGGYYCLIIN